MGADPAYVDLYHFIDLERHYLVEVKQILKGRSPTAPKGDENRLAYYGEKVKNLRLLWYGVDDEIEVDANKFDSLVSGKKVLTIDDYEDLFNCSGAAKKIIKIKGVLKMVDLKDYQKIMENYWLMQLLE